MIKEIKVNAKALESMLFIWASIKDREKVAEQFYDELANSEEMKATMGEDFDEISVRKVLSSISNRERLNGPTKKESRFWNYNMWMLEDPDMTQMMLKPIKQLNLDGLKEELGQDFPQENLEVIFYPGHFDTATIIGNKLYINFFAVKADVLEDGKVTIEDKPLQDFIKEKLMEMK